MDCVFMKYHNFKNPYDPKMKNKGSMKYYPFCDTF